MNSESTGIWRKLLVPALLFNLALGTSAAKPKAEPRGPKGKAAEPAESDAAADGAAQGGETPSGVEERRAESTGEVKIGGTKIGYKATAGTIRLAKDGERPEAAVFYTAYERKGVKSREKRPVTFCFNGGPGSSSVWLHLGAFGPRRLAFEDQGTRVPAPPYKLVDNGESLLDVTDLVFVDPVSTGFSRASKPEEAGAFHGFEGDIDSVAEFVRLYVTREGRWSSPKYLAGESYGAIRVSALADTLQDRFGMYLNGVVIISGVWDFRTLIAHPSNDLPYMLFLPAMVVSAHYHGAVEGDRDKLVAEAESLALGDYALALHRGASLPEDERARMAGRLARLIGIDADYIEAANLRVSASQFRKEVLREKGQTLGRFDARMIGHDVAELGERPEYDASYTLIYGAYASSLNAYVRGDLGFESDLPYEILSGKVRPWDYEPFTNRYVSVADHVSGALRTNKDLRFFIACGHYDLATPPFAIEYTLNHLRLPDAARDSFEIGHYEGGHMMYTNAAALKALKRDLARFLQGR